MMEMTKRLFISPVPALSRLVTRIFVTHEEDAKLLAQMLGTLRTSFQQSQACRDSHEGPINPKIEADIEHLLKKAHHSWEDFYEIERLLVYIYDTSKLDIEIQRRMVDARLFLHPAEYQMYQTLCAGLYPQDAGSTDADKATKQALLVRLLHDIQWGYTKKHVKRIYARSARSYIAIAFLIFICQFFAVDWLLEPGTRNHMVMIAISAGFWGASFSMLLGLKSNLENSHLDDLRVLRTWGFILSRIAIGGGAALILCNNPPAKPGAFICEPLKAANGRANARQLSCTA